MNILITGGNGYIAKNLYEGLKDKHNVTRISRDDFDLTDRNLTDKFFEDKYYDVVLHTAIAGGSRLRKDTEDVLDQNLVMYYNLLANESKYKKFISIGSGAELFAQKEPYGLSKHVINYSMRNKTNFHNVRIFAVFDENELETRFIKSSIIKYLNNQPIEIHQDKLMDFFYMKDLIKLMEYCISAEDLPKEINCSYRNIYHLKDIAKIINRMDENKVPINIVNKKIGVGYVGDFTNLEIDYIGLEKGIENVYSELKKREMQPISFCINTSRNELEYVKLLLKSLKDNLKYDHHEIIIFVDSDNENTFEWLVEQKQHFKDLKILRNILPVCYGYARNINEMFKFASHEIVSYLQSDMVISKNYDEYVLRHVKPNMILSSTRIEPPLHGPGPEKHTMNFGLTPSEFKYEEFLKYCENNRQENSTEYFFAPFTLYKEVWNSIGGHDTQFRRSREDSDVLNRLILSGVQIIQTWEALVYHFTCTSSRGKGWFNSTDEKAQARARMQEQADGIEMSRMFRKWGAFSHGKPFNYHYNIVANIQIDSPHFTALSAVEMFFDKVTVRHIDAYNFLTNVDEHKYANELLNFSQEDWDNYSYLYNTENLQDRFTLGEAKGDIILSFRLSEVTQDTYDSIFTNLQHIIHNAEEGDWEVGGFTLSINKKVNNIEDRIKVTNPEIKPQDLFKVY